MIREWVRKDLFSVAACVMLCICLAYSRHCYGHIRDGCRCGKALGKQLSLRLQPGLLWFELHGRRLLPFPIEHILVSARIHEELGVINGNNMSSKTTTKSPPFHSGRR